MPPNHKETAPKRVYGSERQIEKANLNLCKTELANKVHARNTRKLCAAQRHTNHFWNGTKNAQKKL